MALQEQKKKIVDRVLGDQDGKGDQGHRRCQTRALNLQDLMVLFLIAN